MKVTRTEITDVLVLEPTIFRDERGFFLESWNARTFRNLTQLDVHSSRITSRYFDVRALYYQGFSSFDVQRQIPIIHPVLDYSNVLPQQLLGGELSYKVNLTSLTRQEAEFDAITQAAQGNGACSAPTADTAIPANCLLRGIPGDYTRFSAQVDWRRTLVTTTAR
jgi:LPS-assembly protein